VFRQSEADLTQFTLVGQTVFQVSSDGLGQLLIDISSQPLTVEAGDLLGLHVVDCAVIPYDVDETRLTTIYSQSLDNVDEAARGHTITLNSDLQPAREYSLSANVIIHGLSLCHSHFYVLFYAVKWQHYRSGVDC